VPTPINRVPVRVARGNLATLESSITELYDGELVYGLDTQSLYCKDGGILQPVAGEGVVSINGQEGAVVLNVQDLNDVEGTPAQGDTLVYVDGEFVFQPSVGNGTVTSVDIQGSGGITAAGGPITASGIVTVTLDPTGIVPGEYVTPTVTVDAQGRITSITAGTLPPLELNDLTNVIAPAPGIGDGIIWDGSNWISSPDVGNGGGGGATSLDDLTDVDMSVPPNEGQALLWDDGSNTFKPGDVSSGGGSTAAFLDDLLDVSISGATGGQVLTYSSLRAEWENVDPSLNKVEDIKDTNVDGVQNGDALLWDQATNKWVAAKPLSKGPISLETTTTTSTESPLWGGRTNMDEATWDSMGFTRFPKTGTFFDDLYRTINLNGVDCAADGVTLYSGLTGDPICVVNTNVNVTMSIWQIVTLFVPNWGGSFEPDYAPTGWDFEDDATPGSSIEFSLLIEQADDSDMELVECGVLPRQTINGVDWTIFRSEFKVFDRADRTWAREVWISENGDIKIKQGQPTWNFNWGIQFARQGIYTLTDTPQVTGYGDGVWTDLPVRGSYVVEFSLIEDIPVIDADISDKSINELSDVDTSATAPEIGQLLAWDGTNWVPADAPATGATTLDDLSDVNVSSLAPEDTQGLFYSQADDEWQAANPRATAGAPTETNFPGKPGEMRYTADYFYICVALNTWKQVALSAIGNGPGPDPEIGDIADGGNFLDGTSGTIDTILDGGNWTTGGSGDQQDVVMDGGFFSPNLPGANDTIDGGNFTDGTPGTDFRVDGGNFTTGAAGTANQTLDGGIFTTGNPGPDETVDGGDFTGGGSAGTAYYMDGGNFTTGAAGTGGIQDGGYFYSGVNPANGGDFTTGLGGNLREIVDGGNFTLGWVIDDSAANGGDFTADEAGSANEILDGGDFSS